MLSWVGVEREQGPPTAHIGCAMARDCEGMMCGACTRGGKQATGMRNGHARGPYTPVKEAQQEEAANDYVVRDHIAAANLCAGRACVSARAHARTRHAGTSSNDTRSCAHMARRASRACARKRCAHASARPRHPGPALRCADMRTNLRVHQDEQQIIGKVAHRK